MLTLNPSSTSLESTACISAGGMATASTKAPSLLSAALRFCSRTLMLWLCSCRSRRKMVRTCATLAELLVT